MKFIFSLIFTFQVLAQTIIVGVFEIKPYTFESEKGLDGVLINFLIEIDNELEDINFEFKLYPYRRLLQELRNGSVHMAVFYQNDAAGTNRFKFLKTLGNINYIIGSKNFDTTEKEYVIGVIRSASYGPEIDHLPKQNKLGLKNYHQGIDLLKIGRISHLVIPSTVIDEYCKKQSCEQKAFSTRLKMNEKNNWIHLTSKVSQAAREKIKSAHDKVVGAKSYRYLHDLL